VGRGPGRAVRLRSGPIGQPPPQPPTPRISRTPTARSTAGHLASNGGPSIFVLSSLSLRPFFPQPSSFLPSAFGPSSLSLRPFFPQPSSFLPSAFGLSSLSLRPFFPQPYASALPLSSSRPHPFSNQAVVRLS
jgi:hypothetical protein